MHFISVVRCTLINYYPYWSEQLDKTEHVISLDYMGGFSLGAAYDLEVKKYIPFINEAKL